MKRLRPILAWLLIALLLTPVLSLAEQNTDPTGEPEPTSEEAAATPFPFGASVGMDDEQRAAREKDQQQILKSAVAPGIFVAEALNFSHPYFAKNEHKQFQPGSTTKIMTALLTIETVSLDDVAKAPREATQLGGSNTMLGLATGEEMRVEDLLYGLMLVSGNDCAITLAVYQAGSENAFTERMNRRAAELGMTDTSFTNPSGRPKGSNLSTAYDMALLTQEALQHEAFRTIVSTAEYTIPANAMRSRPKTIRNSNRLVSDAPGKGYHYPYAIGVKTGATGYGTCLVNAAQKEDVTIICVQLGVPGEDFDGNRRELFTRAIKMFDHVFNYEYAYVDAEALLSGYTDSMLVQNADPDDPEGGRLLLRVDPAGATAFRPIREIDALTTGEASFTVETSDLHAVAPVHTGDVAGKATFSCNGRVWYELPLVAARDVAPVPTPVPPTPLPTSVISSATPG